MNKKNFLLTIIFSVTTLASGYFYGNYKGQMESYESFIINNAVESVLHTQALYAMNSNQIEDSKEIIQNHICSNLMIVGLGLKEFPQLKNSEIIQETLAMPNLYAKDFDVDFCGSDSKGIESQALSLANNYPDSYSNFLNKYRKVKIEIQ